MKDWFDVWFDSPYYHLLYKDRNNKEAEKFINKLMLHLAPQKDSKFLDVACGKGRHSIHINSYGFHTTGIDLSKNSIDIAQKNQNSSLIFSQHDMRYPFKKNEYDYAVNLFTSFGYFDDNEDNQKTITAISNSLKDKGKFIIDFMNVEKVINNLKKYEIKKVNNIDFHINRTFKNGCILKEIRFNTNNNDYKFLEKVQALTLDDFNLLLNNSKMKIIHLWGDYELNEFDKEQSNRLIILAEK